MLCSTLLKETRYAPFFIVLPEWDFGEILALRRVDIGTDRLHVRHSWSFADGLKSPKNGEERTAPLLPGVRDELVKLADTNPHGDGFICYHADPQRPCDGEVLRKGLIRALVDMELPERVRIVRLQTIRQE